MKIMNNAIWITMITALLAMGIPVLASNMDGRIESCAKKSYVFKTYLEKDRVQVQSKNGRVTLTGTVAEESHKSLAEETVAGLPGVKSVENLLKIKSENKQKNSDGWLKTKVKATLLFHRNVNAVKTEVNVKDGVVTLTGPADSEAQKELTSEYVKDVEGVKEIKNELAVPNPTKITYPEKIVNKMIDDASITAQIKLMLLYHRSTSALGTKVVTNNGEVTLSGQARNAAEKDLVTKLVTDINGVKSVNNQMMLPEESKNN